MAKNNLLDTILNDMLSFVAIKRKESLDCGRGVAAMTQQATDNNRIIKPLESLIKEEANVIAGSAGVRCLQKAKLDPVMQKFFANLILSYLNRELANLNWQIKVKDNFFTLSWLVKGVRKEWLQLRFAPRCSRWLIMRRGGLKVRQELNGNIWFPHTPDRFCLSLSDWLGQIRKLLTNRFNVNKPDKQS